MVGRKNDPEPARTGTLREEELAAATPVLLVQPALWSALRLPAAEAVVPEVAPWTVYWSVRLDPGADVQTSRSRFAAAFDVFCARGDALGELACAAAIIEGFYVEEGSLDPMDRWIAALEQRLPADADWPSPEFEARILACGVAILLRDPSHSLLARWAARGATLMRRIAPGANRLKLATFLAQYHLWRGEFGRTALIVDALPGLEMTGLLPAEALLWLQTLAVHARCAAQFDRGREAIGAALALMDRHGLHQHAYALHAHGASLALAAGDATAAQFHLDEMRPALDGGPQADQTHYWHFQAGLSLLRGETAHAVELARTALENSGEIGGPYRTATHALSLGQALLRAGETDAALQRIDEALTQALQIDASLIAFTAHLMRAACLLRLGRCQEANAALRQGFGEGARRDFRATALWRMPEAMTEVAQAALTRGIETDYVRRFVRIHALPGADPTLADWPWPLALRGFGQFEATLNDAPLQRAGAKTAQRPLDLLRVMLAHGTGPLPVATALQWLWPDADAAAQRKAFDVALLRLRRTLDDARLLHLEGGRLWLDERWTWSDVAALQVLMQRIGSAHGASLPQLQDWVQRLLELMRGPFLAGEMSDWAHAARQRHQRRFVVAVSQLAAHIEPMDGAAAIRLYERALDVDPLAESLSRRLMRVHASRGDHAEALRVWRACWTMLSVAEGLSPSRETLALATELGLPEPGR